MNYTRESLSFFEAIFWGIFFGVFITIPWVLGVIEVIRLVLA